MLRYRSCSTSKDASKGSKDAIEAKVQSIVASSGIDRSRVDEFRMAFNLLDKDHDGVLAVDEFRSLMVSLGQDPADAEVTRQYV